MTLVRRPGRRLLIGATTAEILLAVLLTADESREFTIADGPALGSSSQWDSDLVACDELYYGADIGTLHEWLGSTCGGREGFETHGSCS